MYVRKKPNRSGSTSVVIVEKRNGKSHYLKTIGVSSDPVEVDNLYLQGKRWIVEQTSGRDMFLEQIRQEEEKLAVEGLLNKIEHILINGTQLILNPVYQNIGFDKINDDVLKHLVVSRICQPQSKVATSDYLKSYFDEDVDLNKIYRYLDKLSDTQKDKIQEISVNHTRKVLGGSIGVVFYDVTTLYFETDEDDELRKKGWSKDGKHSQPQVVLGLLVSKGGYPLAYSIHEGNKYEGHTMLPIVKDFVSKFDLEDFIVVADSGLMNAENIKELEKNNYKYIIGARIKSENQVVREWILSQDKVEGSFYDYQKTEQQRLILGYTEQRARKDANNREKGIKRLEKEYKSGSITKDKINKRGYNKFLKIADNISVEIDYTKIAEDAKWDGLKGYVTNTKLSGSDVYQQYSELWQVERAFRVTKGVLDLRPMFHFTKKRIEAHVCICFVAYKVYKELERTLKNNGIKMSVDKVLSIAKTITTIKVKLQESNETISKTMLITDKHKSISKLFESDFWTES
ncbi:MAG: IS1634 family transposase [Bacteroidales bacterium]|jgi:transposase|nr:IS1634 family transposase [Bacteroidales bacterium]